MSSTPDAAKPPYRTAPHPAADAPSAFQLPPPIWGSPTAAMTPPTQSSRQGGRAHVGDSPSSTLSRVTWQGQRNGSQGARRALGSTGTAQGWDAIQKALGGAFTYSSSLASSPAPAADQRGGAGGREESFEVSEEPLLRKSSADRSWASPPLVGPSSAVSRPPSEAGSDTFCVSAYGKDLVLSVSVSSPAHQHVHAHVQQHADLRARAHTHHALARLITHLFSPLFCPACSCCASVLAPLSVGDRSFAGSRQPF